MNPSAVTAATFTQSCGKRTINFTGRVNPELIRSSTRPNEMMRNSLWHIGETENDVKLQRKDPQNIR
jgi:syndecan 4